MRLFVSIDLAPELTAAIAAVHASIEDAPGLRFTDPEQAHVTIKFLGEVPMSRVDPLVDALDRAVEVAAVEPFDVTFGGVGVFPSLEYITVVWFGVQQGAASMIRLHEEIEAATVNLGFSPERHDFTPHVTIARMQHGGAKPLVQDWVRSTDPTIGVMTVSDVCLTESIRTEDGQRYETLARFPL